MSKADKGKLSTKEKVIIIVAVALIICSILVAAGVFVMNYNFFEDKTAIQGEPIITEQIQTPVQNKEKVVTFLVLGIGDDENERENTELTDTIMVATVDLEKKQVNVLQIPRDTYVGRETTTGKINAIYKQKPDIWDYAGLKGLTQMIYEMFQLNIDHYVTITMDAFQEVIDLIGGVEMDVPTEMELNGTYVKAGRQTLSGEQAIAVVRTRNVYANADLGRLDTQKIFLSALVQKCLNLGVGEMTKLVPTMMRSISTDLTAADMLEYYDLIQGLDLGNIQIATVPGDGAMVDGQSVYSVYTQQTADLLNENFRPYSDDVLADELQIKTILKENVETKENEMIGFDDFEDEDESEQEESNRQNN